jgi:hypothetical protein
MGLLTGHCYLSGRLFELGLADNPGSDWCKEAFEMASRVLCDCKTLMTQRFRHQGQHFLKPGDFDDISINRKLYFVQSVGLLNA